MHDKTASQQEGNPAQGGGKGEGHVSEKERAPGSVQLF